MAMSDEIRTAEPGAAAPNEQPSIQNRQLIFSYDDQRLVATLRAWYMEDHAAQEEERKNREIDWRMWAGDQWEITAKQRAVAENRPALTLNYVLPTICAIEGEERSNRQQIKVYGVDDGDDDRGAYAFNLLIRGVMNENNGEYSVSTAFRHATIGGQGWLHPDVDYFADPEGLICVRHVDEDEIILDCQSVAPDASDARRLTRMRWLKDDELEGMFPGALEKLTDYAEASCVDTATGIKETDAPRGAKDVYVEPGKMNTKVYDARKKEWLVLEHWWFEIEPGMVARNPDTDELEELTMEQGEALKSAHVQKQRDYIQALLRPVPGAPMPTMPQPVQMMQRPVRRYYQAFSCAGQLLQKNPSPIPEARRIPYVPVFGYYDKVKRQRFGVVRNIADIQRQHNVEQSALVHMVQLAPKAGWMAPRGAFHDRQRWMSSAAKPGALLEYNQQKGKPEPLQQPAIPRHLVDLSISRMQAMKAISGVNTELTGERVAGDAGVVMEMRKKAALTILATLFDNLRLAKKVLGKLLIVYIQAFMPLNRRMRIMGPKDSAEYVAFTQDLQFARFDAAVDETEATVNDRIQTLTLLQTVLPTLIDAGIPIPPGMIDLFPIPPHVRDEWKAMLMNNAPPGLPRPGAPPQPGAPPAAAPPAAAPPPQPQ